MKKEVIELEAIWFGGGFHFILQEDKTGLVLRKFDADFDEDSEPTKIDKEIFPNTDPVPYWTGEQNKYAKKHYWSVNFYTGNTYGRFFPYQNLAVRLVRDR